MRLDKKKIKMRMLELDLNSDRALAELLGKQTFVVNRWLNGVHLPRTSDMRALLAALQLTDKTEILTDD